MKIYKQDNDYTIYQGDSFEVLDTLEEKSIDAIVTDPPYGLTSITKRYGKEDSAPAKEGKDGSSPQGYGYITKKGYHRVWDAEQKKYRFEHNIVWEKNYGKIPQGMQVHHIDGNKQNNNIENLKLVDALTHKRLHSGCIEKNGIILKPCKKCGVFKPISDYYKRKDGISSRCKECCIKNAVENKKRRKLNDNYKRTISKTSR